MGDGRVGLERAAPARREEGRPVDGGVAYSTSGPASGHRLAAPFRAPAGVPEGLGGGQRGGRIGVWADFARPGPHAGAGRFSSTPAASASGRVGRRRELPRGVSDHDQREQHSHDEQDGQRDKQRRGAGGARRGVSLHGAGNRPEGRRSGGECELQSAEPRLARPRSGGSPVSGLLGIPDPGLTQGARSPSRNFRVAPNLRRVRSVETGVSAPPLVSRCPFPGVAWPRDGVGAPAKLAGR